MARISSQPGKTQTINYYNINDLCYMVDLLDMVMLKFQGDSGKMGAYD